MGLCMASLTDGAICFVFFFQSGILSGVVVDYHNTRHNLTPHLAVIIPHHLTCITFIQIFFSLDIIPLFYCVFSNPLDLHVTHFLPICIFCLPLAGISTAIHNSLIAISRSLSLFWNFLFSLSLHIFTSTLFPPHPLLCGYFFVSSTLLNCTPPGG